MRRFAILLTICLLALSVARAAADPAPGRAAVTLSPDTGTVAVSHQLQARNLPPLTSMTLVLIAPDGSQQVFPVSSDASGALTFTFQVPGGGWQVGLYRAVLGLSDGESVSATFVAGDNAPHLYALPDLPSPTSAFNIVGIGMAPNSPVDLVLSLTGGQDSNQTLHVTTDARGAFSLFVFPQQFGVPFFAAGDYRIAAPALGLTVPFRVREHPVSAAVTIPDPVPSSGGAQVHLENYTAGRYVWGVYANASGAIVGELLVGPTDPRGVIDVTVRFTRLAPGVYYLATPYDWGETRFVVPASQPASTSTPVAGATGTPVPTTTAGRAATRTFSPRRHPGRAAR